MVGTLIWNINVLIVQQKEQMSAYQVYASKKSENKENAFEAPPLKTKKSTGK
jgi:hypothetical protein